MLEDSNNRIDKLVEEFELITYDLVSDPAHDINTYDLIMKNSKILDDILVDLKLGERNYKIDILIETHEQSKAGTKKGNR